MPDPKQENLDALLQENRLFPPSDEFRKQANANDPEIYERALRDPENFWATASRAVWTGSRPGTQYWNGKPPGRNGFSAES